MESKQEYFIFKKAISLVSIFMLVFGNSFFVYAESITDVMENVVNTSSDNIQMFGEALEHDFDHDHEHGSTSISTGFINFSQVNIGEEIEIEGILEKLIGEGPNGFMEETYLLYDDSYGKSFILDLNGIINDSYVGSRVVLGGIDGENIFKIKTLLSNQGLLQSQVAAAEFTPEIKNIRNVAIFMVEVSGKSTIWNKTTADNKIFGNTNSAKEYFHETSYGELEINSDADNNGENDVFGPFIVDGAGKCEYSTWRSQSVQQANALGIDTSKYHNIILILPSYSQIGCNWAGLGNVGSVDSNFTQYSWIAYSSNSVVQHELGHNFGMGHASTDTDNNGTVNSEYGDQSGVMGGPAGMPLKIGVNAPHLDQLNWGDHIEGYYEFATLPATNYILQPLQLDPNITSGTRVIKFPKKNNNEFYYVSYRQPVGYNSQMYSKYQPGLTIHTYRGSGYANTKLVKTLSNGESFFDATNNIRITSQGIDEATQGMKVFIETNPGTCVKGNMSAYKVTNPSFLKSNEEGVINLKFINNDLDCEPQNISLVKNIDSQLDGIFSSSGITLHPQDTKETGFIFNTGNADRDYFYSLTAIDNDGINPDHGTFTFTGTISVDGTKPTDIINLSYNKINSNYRFSWSPSIDNGSEINKYEIHRSTGSGFSLLRNIYPENSIDSLSFDDTNLGANKYSYKVIAVDNVGNKSNDSNIVVIDNSNGLCVFNGGELVMNSRNISTNTGSVLNLEYKLDNKNINCNPVSFNLSQIGPDGFTTILDQTNITLNSGESMTGVLQVQTATLPGEYKVVFSNQSLDYTQGNKIIKNDTEIYIYLNGEYITKPEEFTVIKNESNYNFSWSGSTYISVGNEPSSGGNEKENAIIYELYRSELSDFNNFNLVYSGSNTIYTDILINENQYKYQVIATNGRGLFSEKSNNIDVNFILPENITGSFVFSSGAIINNINTQLELNASVFPVNYVITGDITQTGSLTAKQNIDVNISTNDGLKILNIQYFGNNGKSPIISNSIILDTTKPVLALLTDISGSGTTAENILLTGTVSDLNGINNLTINGNNIGINNNTWSENINLNIGLNNVNYILSDNAGNTQTGTFVINRINVPIIEDNTPDIFNFTQLNNAQLSTEYNSNTITITGINTGSIITINNGSYSINNNDFTTLTGVVFNNNNLIVKGLSSGEYSTNTTVEVNIGGVVGNYIITTKSKPSSGGGGGGGGSRPKPKILCTIEEHLVCESSRKGIYSYYKKSGAVCVGGDLGKTCTKDEEKEDEEKEEYTDIKKILLEDSGSLKNNNIDDILKLLKVTDYNNTYFEYNTSADYNDSQVRKIFIINNNKFNTYKEKINNIKYLSEDFNKYLYYLEINNSELNKILLLLEQSRKEKVKTDILKYYREYKIIRENIKSINSYLNNIGSLKTYLVGDEKNIAYIKYKEKTLRKKQTILFIKLKRKEFNIDLFIEINQYLYTEYISLNKSEPGDLNNVIYKKILEKISKL